MYRCYGCDAPANVKCDCQSERQAQEPAKEKEEVRKINIASGEDVCLEEVEYA